MSNRFQITTPAGFVVLIVSLILPECKKFVQIDPPANQITGSIVFSNNTSAAAVMTGLYSNMMNGPTLCSGNLSIGYYMGLAADELTNYDPNNTGQVQFYENALSSFTNNSSNYYFWAGIYNDIYAANAELAGLSNSNSVTSQMREQLVGEAKFMRAFLNFYATNLYGAIPLATSTDYLTNNTISRTPQSQVYQQIITDLLDAQSKLATGFVDGTGNSTSERTRPNQGAATALLARAYLYTGKWDSAELESTSIINNTAAYGLDSINAIFLANSTEAIWQLQPVTPGYNTWDAYDYVTEGPPGPGLQVSVGLSSSLITAFEAGDERFADWIDTLSSGGITYYYPYKYKIWQQNLPVTEYTMVLRLGEQYLIRAEARAQQGNLSGALNDINVIRNRAGLSNYGGVGDQPSILAAILHERQVELFTEWGHRWFDLARTNNLNSLMGSPGNICQTKGGVWNQDWVVLPIARQELVINPNLTQNPGYGN